MLENYFIEHCSTTMASLKCASLFNCTFTDKNQFCGEIEKWNTHFAAKGIKLHILRQKQTSALVYMCRYSKLSERLADPEIVAFLQEYGYEDMSTDAVINRLALRIQRMDIFPHEIGIMLDYPLYDVECFIRHKGEKCKCAGCWKVYGDENEARKTFARFKKCRAVYKKLYDGGRSVMQLTVAA